MPNPVDLTTLSSDLPVFLQNGIGVGYSAIDARRAIAVGLQEGVVAPGAAKVTQRAGGAGMAVDVAAFEALVKGDTVADEGMYYVRRASALTGATELTATAADGVNPRIDQVILEIKNDVHDGSGLNRGRIRYLAGTATAGATLANRTGAAALPNSAIRLADILMPAAAANVPTANILDRRPWARGGFRSLAGSAAGNYTRAISSYAAIDAVALQSRMECSGVPVRLTLSGGAFGSTPIAIQMFVDGAGVTLEWPEIELAAGAARPVTVSGVYIPAAGSHLFAPFWKPNTAVAVNMHNGSANVAPKFVVEELVRQNSDNT